MNVQRFLDKIDKRPDGCWIWNASKGYGGYGQFGYVADGRRWNRGAHRVAYELFVGPIPDGLTIDHLCRVRACVNPAHLEAVTNRENVLRGDTIPARHAAKTRCANGHEFTPENTRLYTEPGRRSGTTTRVCLTCKKASNDRSNAKQKERAACLIATTA